MTDSNLPIYAFGFLFSLILTVILEKRLIPALKSHAKQPIYQEGPSWHMQKSGTPTMGGLAFLVAGVVALLIAVIYFYIRDETYFATSLLLSTMYALASSLIGIFDDMTKIRKKENAGLSPMQKLILQSIAAILFLFLRYNLLRDSTKLYFSFGSYDIGWFYYPLAFISLIATVNCANLTDGIDGLASGVAFAIGVSLFYMSFSICSDTALIGAVLIGISIGFLFFNLHPAKIFMGDTGSLFFGGIVGASAISLRNPLIALFIGVVYVIEGLSVIIQVVFFKLTGKRVFKMSPLHHHFEKMGFSENKIVLSFMFLTFIMATIAYTMFL